jgi:hypothetical protein
MQRSLRIGIELTASDLCSSGGRLQTDKKKVRGMNTYSNPLTDYSPQMEFYGGPAGGHFHRKRGSGVPTDSEEMELATEFMDVARIDYDIALTDSTLMDLPRAAVWCSCCFLWRPSVHDVVFTLPDAL